MPEQSKINKVVCKIAYKIDKTTEDIFDKPTYLMLIFGVIFIFTSTSELFVGLQSLATKFFFGLSHILISIFIFVIGIYFILTFIFKISFVDFIDKNIISNPLLCIIGIVSATIFLLSIYLEFGIKHILIILMLGTLGVLSVIEFVRILESCPKLNNKEIT